jgi:hypothetical protein
LNRRVTNDEVPPNDISVSSRLQRDPIGIPAGRVELDDVVVDGGEGGKCWAGPQQADAEFPSLSCIAVSNDPVRTDPGAAGAAVQSYATAGKGAISISYRGVAAQVVTGPAADQHAGAAIGGRS